MRYTFLLFLIILLASCDKDNNDLPDPEVTSEYIKYTVSTEDFVNPDRGFYKYSETRSENYSVLSANTLKGYRNNTVSSGSSYSTYNSLVFRYYVLGDFTQSAISQSYLDNMQKDFDAAREAGVKLIPRFTYTTTAVAGACSEGFICPPYGDASKAIVLQHISQVGPILTTNKDVILTVQMGFIGTWGENYYTDFFGDASSNAGQGKLLDGNWQDRIDVLKALLDATPPELMIQVRYPQMKQRAIYGIDAKTNVNPLTESEAFTGTDIARIAFHNDCLFASADDFGTYADYGNSSSPSKTDISNLKPYFANDSKYVVVGGETCFDGYSPQNDCAPAGMADTDLRLLHYTYLNADYNNQVNNDWVDGGCMEDIKKNMGYRLVLDSALLPLEVALNEQLKIDIRLRNIGYASPVKKRPVYLVLKEEATGKEFKLEFDTDIRFWLEGVELTETLDLPGSITVGIYDLYLSLPDAQESIANRPEYAIRVANENTWDESLGYNNLNHSIEIK